MHGKYGAQMCSFNFKFDSMQVTEKSCVLFMDKETFEQILSQFILFLK